MIVTVSEDTKFHYEAGGYGDFNVSLAAGPQEVDDKFGAYILANYPDVVVEGFVRPIKVDDIAAVPTDVAPETTEEVVEPTPEATPATKSKAS